MKKILLLIIMSCLFFCLKSVGQNTRDGKISDNSSFQGKRQLKKEKRIHHKASTLTASNAKAAKKRNAKGGLPRSAKKPSKNKEKNKSVVIEEKKLANAEPKRD